MLLPKPFLLSKKNKKGDHILINNEEDKKRNEELISNYNTNLTESHDTDEHDEPFSELMIHQLIETIEFVMASVSNTASYLRLWALSLAHGQLSKVFLDLIIRNSFSASNNIVVSVIHLILAFPFFIAVTFGVLMIMDLMECFLHALRLHWVEFQNKFFKGNGVRFVPYKI